MTIKALYRVEVAGTNEEPEGYAVVYLNTNNWTASWLVSNMYQASRTILTHCLGHMVDSRIVRKFEEKFLADPIRAGLHHGGKFEITPAGVNRWEADNSI